MCKHGQLKRDSFRRVSDECIDCYNYIKM